MLENPRYGTREWVELLKQLHNNQPELTKIDLCFSSLPSVAAKELFEAIHVNKTLTDLYLLENNLTGEDIVKLFQQISQHPSLTALHLKDDTITDKVIRAIAPCLQQMTSLKTLSLGSQIGDEGAEVIVAALKINRSLNEINLNSNRISDKGAIAFANLLQQNTILTSLNLLENQIRDEGALAIASALGSNTTLKSLALIGNAYTAVGTQALLSSIENNISLTFSYVDKKQESRFIMRRNRAILGEPDPVKKANLIGQVKGIYQAPSLEALGLFAVKKYLPKTEIEQLKDQLPEELYDKLIQP